MNKKYLPILAAIFIITVFAGVLAFAGCSTSDTQEESSEDINIIFFPGGSENDSFAQVVYNGARAAQGDLGVNIEYMWSGWNPDKMVMQFKEAISKDPDGIVIMGHPGEEVLMPLIDEAFRKGIIVTSANVDLSGIRDKYVGDGMGYVGQDLYSSGMQLSKGAIRKYGFKEGDEALVIGLDKTNSPKRTIRAKGVVDGLVEGGVITYLEEMPQEVNTNPYSEAGEKYIASMLDKYPNIKLVVTDHGLVTGAMTGIFKKLGKSPKDVIVAGFDIAPATVDGINEGYIGLVHDQQQYLQGYLPVLSVYMSKKYGFTGLYIDTGVGLVDESNVSLVSELAKNKIR